eukprot:363062-Chlamydomonas_euryale.AAC.5
MPMSNVKGWCGSKPPRQLLEAKQMLCNGAPAPRTGATPAAAGWPPGFAPCWGCPTCTPSV